MDKRDFKGEVKKQLYLRNWSYSDLAEHTKYTPRSVGQMMYDDNKMNPIAMKEIAKALDIQLD